MVRLIRIIRKIAILYQRLAEHVRSRFVAGLETHVFILYSVMMTHIIKYGTYTVRYTTIRLEHCKNIAVSDAIQGMVMPIFSHRMRAAHIIVPGLLAVLLDVKYPESILEDRYPFHRIILTKS